MNDPKSYPEEWCDPLPVHIQIQALRRIEAELAQHVRAQAVIDDIKRRCGVSTKEGPSWNGN